MINYMLSRIARQGTHRHLLRALDPSPPISNSLKWLLIEKFRRMMKNRRRSTTSTMDGFDELLLLVSWRVPFARLARKTSRKIHSLHADRRLMDACMSMHACSRHTAPSLAKRTREVLLRPACLPCRLEYTPFWLVGFAHQSNFHATKHAGLLSFSFCMHYLTWIRTL